MFFKDYTIFDIRLKLNHKRTKCLLNCLTGMILRFIVFLALNFGALGLGAFLMGSPLTNEWYNAQNLAPWTPPGWVFGAAWFTIMLLFAVFLAAVWHKIQAKKQFLFALIAHYILNVSWNPTFFQLHWVLIGLIIISLLFIVVVRLTFSKGTYNKSLRLLLLPYLTWLLIAISLNFYVLVFN